MFFEEFNAAIQALDEILECHLVSGDFDYLLKTRVADMAAYRNYWVPPYCAYPV